jgi:hypothetical protein
MGDQEPFSRGEFLFRVGTFLVLVATVLLFFFLLSEAADQAEISYFCWSTLLFTLGFMARSRYRRAVRPSGRFSIFKRNKKGDKNK